MNFKITKAMLMAAGLGTRLRPFTESKTKALLPLMGIPIAQYAVDCLRSAGVDVIVANIHHDAANTEIGLKNLDLDMNVGVNLISSSTKMVISDESQLLLGSAGGIRKALSHFRDEPFYLANADVLNDIEWEALGRRHQYLREKFGVWITLALFSSGPSGGAYREIFFDSDSGLIQGLGQLEEGKPFFIGAAVLEPEAFANLSLGVPSDFVKEILCPAIEKGKAGFYLTEGVWQDIGSPELWLKAHLFLMNWLETGNCRSKASHIWRSRLLRSNQRLSKNVWISSELIPPPKIENWASPCYWGKNETENFRPLGEFGLGPNAVLYGQPLSKKIFQNGIGFQEQWISLK